MNNLYIKKLYTKTNIKSFELKLTYFREEQDNEFLMLRREFDQVSKNCRILAFKFKKAERRMEELDNEKIENDKKTKEVRKK